MPCCLFIQLPELLFPVQGTARGALEAVGLTITPSLSSPLPLTRALSYELPLLCVLYKPSLNTSLLWGGGLQQNRGGVFFRQPSHGKRHLCTSVSPPFTHGQSPSVRPCCMCSLPGMHKPGFDFGPCPSCSKAGGQHPPFSSPRYPQSSHPRGPPSCIHFHTSIIILEETSSELGAAGARLRWQRGFCGSVPLATHCLLWERPQMPLRSHGRVMME